MAEELFDPTLIGDTYNPEVVARLQAGGQPPGVYDVNVSINNKSAAHQKLAFIVNPVLNDGVGLVPCMMQNQYLELGIDVHNPEAQDDERVGTDKEQCVPLSDLSFVTYRFLFTKKQLELTVPDNKLIKRASGYIPPSLYDNGEPVLLTSYRFSDIRSINGGTTSQQYLSMTPGANLGAWRLRSQLSKSGQDSQFRSSFVYLQRDFTPIKSSFRVGQQGLRSSSFDAPYFNGLQMWTSDEMLSSGAGSYTPIVRGVAKSLAMVTITQNDRQVYQGSVAAGPFEIRDLNIFGSGDLVVSIIEANGEETRFIQPFSTGFDLLAVDTLKYNMAVGEIDSDVGTHSARRFAALEAKYGLPFSATLTGGVQKSQEYTALAGGMGFDMGFWGASFFDTVYTHYAPSAEKGQLLRARYAKSFDDVGFDFNAGITHYLNQYTTLSQTQSFSSPLQHLYPGSSNSTVSDTQPEYSGSQFDVGFSQSLPTGYGSVGANFSATRGREQDKRSYALTYSNSFGSYNLSLSLSRAENALTGQPDTSLSLGVNYIFGSSTGNSRLLRYDYASVSSQSPVHRFSMNGTEFDDNALSWGGRAEIASSGDVTASGVDAVYRHSLARINASVSHAQGGDTTLNSGIQGGVVAHLGGITFTDQLSDTNILLRAENVKGLRATSDQIRRTDGAGYMLLPGTAYRYNDVSLDGASIPDTSRLLSVKKTLVPTQGAVVMANFPSVTGTKMLVTLKDTKGELLAAGSLVLLEDTSEEDTGKAMIDDFGRVYFEGIKQTRGRLTVKGGQRQVCSAEYDTSGVVVRSGIHMLSLTCR